MGMAAFEKVSSQGIHYLDIQAAGSPAVLLIHGLGANRLSWQLQIEALAKAGYRCIAPDLPGFGNSLALKGRMSIPRLANSMVTLLDELEIPQAVVVGLSMGGTVALTLALNSPRHVERLVLVSTFSRLRPASMSEARYFLRRVWVVYTRGLTSQARVVAERVFPGDGQESLRKILEEQIQEADPRTYRSAMRSLGFFNVTRRLKELRMPVMVITGADDSTIPVNVQRSLAAGVSGAKHVIVPRAGHGVIADQPDVFNRELMSFIQDKAIDESKNQPVQA